MEKISEMIERMCPEGVEYVKLGEICDCITGGDTPTDCIKGQSKPTKEYPYPVYANGDETYGYASHYRIDKPAVTISSIGNVGTAYYREAYFTPIIRLKTFIPKNRNLNIKFLYYCLSVMSFVGTNSSLSSMKAADFKKREIPLPPLPIQQEIVRILDSFTSMITNLETELASRQKQYEYYRNELLTFDENDETVEWKTLGEICEVINGRAYKQQELLNSGKYRVLRVGNFFSNDSWYYSDLKLDEKYYCQQGDLLYAWSASFGPHIWEEEKVIYHYHIWKMNCTNAIDKKFLFYWLQSNEMKNQVESEIHGATMAHLTKALVERLKISLPSTQRQQEIVSTLDTFESLISNIKQELDVRKKQYEYYREKLLTFE